MTLSDVTSILKLNTDTYLFLKVAAQYLQYIGFTE